jgi:hypothetical protein
MAWTSVIMESGRCLTGLAEYPIEMDTESWVQTGEYRTGILEANVPCVIGCTLYLEGCESFGGQWSELAAIVTSGFKQYFLRRDAPLGSSERLPRYLRWRVGTPSGPWSVTFRLALVLKD